MWEGLAGETDREMAAGGWTDRQVYTDQPLGKYQTDWAGQDGLKEEVTSELRSE